MVSKIEQYKWSSINEYINKAQLVDSNFLLKMFSENPKEAIHDFIDYNNEINDCVCVDMEDRIRVADHEARDIIKDVCKVDQAGELQNLEIKIRNEYLKVLKEQYGLSIRQIERITGINRGIILKA